MRYYSEETVKKIIADTINATLHICEPEGDYHYIEIKEPNGRLIDVDKLLEEHPRISPKYPSETFYENLDIFNMLDDAQTVIEASTEERE